MANEFVHGTVGTSLTQAEFEGIGLHVFNNQATGDVVYASSTTQLSRLAKGAANTVLVMGASIPAWSATLAGLTLTAPVINGSVTTTGLTLPAVTLGGTVTATGQEIDAAILDACVAKGTWTASGTWTIPAVTLGAAITLNGQNLNAGAVNMLVATTGSGKGIAVTATNDGADGAELNLYQVSASPANSDTIGRVTFQGKDSNADATGYVMIRGKIENVTHTTECGSLLIQCTVNGSWNDALTLSSAGVLAVDLGGSGSAAQVDLFDDYDDALVLKQGIQQNNRELLADMGILDRKDSGSGYMMKVQPMIRLLAGGIYQTRQMLEDTVTNLTEKIDLLENKIKLIEG
uniref:Uncharacterized protein n=1 Tax=viral metagenome TaxID=1070528 RepID=A0A6M3JU02_9ZZZZ